MSVDFAARVRSHSSSCLPLLVVLTRVRFTSLTWGEFGSEEGGKYPLGLIAGGMSSGSIILWDADKILKGAGAAEAEVAVITSCSTAVTSLQFNPHDKHLLAAGDE